jgi:hypothetical protein
VVEEPGERATGTIIGVGPAQDAALVKRDPIREAGQPSAGLA